MIDQIVEEFKKRVEVDAVLLGGSRATGTFDEKSDYDFYIYLNQPLAEQVRKDILNKYCSYMEYSNQFWELEDDGVLNNGVEIEFIYRDIVSMEKSLESTVSGNVGNGYTTCFIDNLLDSKIMFDKTGKIQLLKSKYKDSLSEDLIQAIVDNNYPIIYEQMPAMYKQVKKAVDRNDLHSINHRITAYFEIYYDVLFAINKEFHPGEKRLLTEAAKLKTLPNDFIENVENVFNKVFNDNEDMLKSLKKLSLSMRDLLLGMGYLKQ